MELTAPVLVGDLQLDEPLPDLNTDGRFESARLLVWLHGLPIGEAAFELRRRPLTSAELASQVWPQVREVVAEHCADEGLPVPDQVPPSGLVRPERPRCAQRRQVAANSPSITVIIATRNRTESLLRCLDSLSKLNYSPFDVVVADSAPSSDETEQALSRSGSWPFELHYLRVSRPGLALAHNAALRAATGEFVAITDDDTEVEPDWLTVLANAFLESDATCVTGLILPAELETPAQLLVERAGGFARGFSRRTFQLGRQQPDPLFPFTAGRFGSGANMAFRTDWLKGRGGFDAATGAGTPARGGDDLIAFLAVLTDGGRLVYEPAAVLRHWHRREYEGVRRQAYGYGVGLGAYLTASVAAKPGLLARMIRLVMPALRHLLDPRSVKNEGRGPGFPRELIWLERAGILRGPFAYAHSRWRYRQYKGL
jgi:glycosyltransferase involved in cell wall biosynthesis